MSPRRARDCAAGEIERDTERETALQAGDRVGGVVGRKGGVTEFMSGSPASPRSTHLVQVCV